MAGETTITASGPEPSPRGSAVLFVALTADQPLAASSRHDLDGVRIAGVERGEKRLTLRLADRRVSAPHARMTREGEHWLVEDLDSKNGVHVNGARVGKTR